MNLRDVKIGTRLALGFGSILLLLVLMVALANVLHARHQGALLNALGGGAATGEQAASASGARMSGANRIDCFIPAQPARSRNVPPVVDYRRLAS